MTNEIIEGAEEALGFLRCDKSKGRVHKVIVKDLDVKVIRTRLHMTQEVFSETFAIPVSTVKTWETNKRVPEGPTKAYLMVIDKNPKAVQSALSRVS